MMCQCSKKYTTLVSGIANEEALHVWAGGTWEISARFSQFCCKPKTTLKNKVFNKN